MVPHPSRITPSLVGASLLLSLIAGFSTTKAFAEATDPKAPTLEKTEPGQVKSGPYDGNPPPAIALKRPPLRSMDRIVYAFDGPVRSQLTREPTLTAACRRGEFLQRVNMLYRAFGPQENALGVAFGRSAINLIDLRRLRAVDRVYFFDRQDTGLCEVYSALQDNLRPWYVRP